jgi:hypothetical protein
MTKQELIDLINSSHIIFAFIGESTAGVCVTTSKESALISVDCIIREQIRVTADRGRLIIG